jgi:hypothetical protein
MIEVFFVQQRRETLMETLHPSILCVGQVGIQAIWKLQLFVKTYNDNRHDRKP